MEINKIYNEDCLTGLKKLDDESIDCCITSPPYFGLRDYGHEEQIGLEQTPELFVAKMVEVFTEVKRALKPDGTLWFNMGDTYYNYRGTNDFSTKQTISNNKAHEMQSASGKRNFKNESLKGKDLIGIPWMCAFALRSAGWYLRQDIIWNKPNPMPESVTDRCTKAHEYIFLLSKSSQYYYDNEAIKEESVDEESYTGRRERNAPTMAKHDLKNLKNAGSIQENGKLTSGQVYEKRNKRSVWTVTTRPFKDSHFATFPERLITDMIKAGCREGGLILDPFMGAGTTAVVARKLQRNFIGFELNAEYLKIAENRLRNELGMFL